MFKVGKLALHYGKIHGVHTVFSKFIKILLFFNATAKFVNCSLFLKNPEKILQFDVQDKTKFTATFIGKFVGINLSITNSLQEIKIYRLLSVYRPGLFKIIDYCHRFSSGRLSCPPLATQYWAVNWNWYRQFKSRRPFVPAALELL